MPRKILPKPVKEIPVLVQRDPTGQNRPLRMFVWENVLRDYTPGLACALAYDVEQARALIRASADPPEDADEFDEEPDVYDVPKAVHVYGGG